MSRTIFIAAALALAVTLPAVPAQAAAGRTFVSVAGSDSNPCTITLPCRNFEAAYMQTSANGQIDALDPGNYGALTITGPVTIQGHGWTGMSTTTGATITINAPGATDKIAISGVVLDGLGIVGTNGIIFNSGGTLAVRDSVIRNFNIDGIHFSSSTANLSKFFVSNTIVSDNGQRGINIFPTGTGITNVVLDHVKIENNSDIGLYVITGSQTINVTVSDSVSANNSAGIAAQSEDGTAVSIMVRNSTMSNNAADGVSAQSPGAVVRVTRSTITGNVTGWDGNVQSYGDNNIDGNSSGGNSEPPAPLTYH